MEVKGPRGAVGMGLTNATIGFVRQTEKLRFAEVTLFSSGAHIGIS